MNCPFCQNALISGHLRGRELHELRFVPDEQALPPIILKKQKVFTSWSSTFIDHPVLLCSHCRKIIMDY